MGTTGKSGRGKGTSAAPAGRPAGKSTAEAPSRPKVSAKVYRRRRIVAGVMALLVIAALVVGGFFVAGLFGANAQDDAQSGVAGGGSTGQAKPPAKLGTPPSAVCDEAGIKVSASADKPSYAGEEKPVLTLQVTNSGKAHCDINVGTSQMEFVITSGDDIIFNSKFCQTEATDLVKNLAPGASEKANMVWNLNRTAPECAKVVSEPGRGGATYALVATLGKWSSQKVTFTLQ
ncbi:hypothetical protein ACX80D_00305 [Arthrobacter sp. Sr24]